MAEGSVFITVMSLSWCCSGYEANTPEPSIPPAVKLTTSGHKNANIRANLTNFIPSWKPVRQGRMLNFLHGGRAKVGYAGELKSEEYVPTWDTYANHSQVSNPICIAKAKEPKGEKPILSPAIFIEKALRAAKGRELKASAAYAAYEAECKAREMRQVRAIRFWQTLSARAKKLGASKAIQDGRVVYLGLRLAA